MVSPPDLSALDDRAAIGVLLSVVRSDLDLVDATLPYLAGVLPETAGMLRRRTGACRFHLDEVERRLGIATAAGPGAGPPAGDLAA